MKRSEISIKIYKNPPQFSSKTITNNFNNKSVASELPNGD